MSEDSRAAVSKAAQAAASGRPGAVARLLELVYADLKEVARVALRRERRSHTLQATALVHEAYLRLIDQRKVDWRGRTHFLALSAQAMRRILVDHARKRGRLKRGEARPMVDVDVAATVSPSSTSDVLQVDELLERLAAEDPRQARILELRFFGGLSVAEVASVLQVSRRTVEAEWTLLRSWLRREMKRGGAEE